MDLKSSIADLYRVFRPYRLGPDFAGCDHCVDPRETELLAKTPLHDLSLEALRRYSFKAMTTWGEAKHFKHFLPRLFELAVDAPSEFELEVLFGKLEYAKWQEWPTIERDSVEGYLREFWRAAIGQPPMDEYDETINKVLCSLASACSTLRPFLEDWLLSEAVAAGQQLAQFIIVNHDDLIASKRLANGFWYWEGVEARAAEVIAWLRSPAVGVYLQAHQAELAEWQGGTLSLLDAIALTS